MAATNRTYQGSGEHYSPSYVSKHFENRMNWAKSQPKKWMILNIAYLKEMRRLGYVRKDSKDRMEKTIAKQEAYLAALL